MNEPIRKIEDLAVSLLVGETTLQQISEECGQDTVTRIEEFLRTEQQYDCYGG